MPTRAAPDVEEFARRLLAYEAASATTSDQSRLVGFQGCEKLRPALGKVIGLVGFRTLLSRALVIASRTTSRLRSLQVKDDGSLSGLEEYRAKLESHTVAEDEVILLSQLLALLITFIGAEVTLRLLRDIWPEMKNLNFAEDNHHEEK
jgi:hypothetical protein